MTRIFGCRTLVLVTKPDNKRIMKLKGNKSLKYAKKANQTSKKTISDKKIERKQMRREACQFLNKKIEKIQVVIEEECKKIQEQA